MNVILIYCCGEQEVGTIDIDEEQLERARRALGTSGAKDTIAAALIEVVRRSARKDLIEMLRTGRGIDRGPEILRASKAR